MVTFTVQKEIDEDLANSGGSLDINAMGGVSRSGYPKVTTGILVCRHGTNHALEIAPVNLRLMGGRERIVLYLRVGMPHPLQVAEVFIEHTNANGIVMLGQQ